MWRRRSRGRPSPSYIAKVDAKLNLVVLVEISGIGMSSVGILPHEDLVLAGGFAGTGLLRRYTDCDI
jgi:hypothetical protein